MPYFIFTEDEKGRFGYLGQSFYSKVQADNKAEDYDCITHIVSAQNLIEAKRKLRNKVARQKKDIGLLYRNVRSGKEL